MEFLPLCIETIPEEIQEKVLGEIKETEENVKNGLKFLREFLKSENIPSRTDDAFLLWFLRAHKFNIKKSQDKLRRYCAMRRNQREFFDGANVEKMRVVLEHQMLGFLPYRDKHGRAVLFTRAHAWDSEKFDLIDAFRCGVFLGHYCFSFPMTSICGVSYIADAKCNSMMEMYSLFKALMSNISTAFACPCRVQKVDVIKEHRLLHHLYTAAKALLPTKLTKRVFMRGTDVQMLKENYHISHLPYEFGGTLGPLSNDCYREKFLEFVIKMKSETAYFIEQ